jgi:hypothetical protein
MQSVLVSLENGTALVLPFNVETIRILELLGKAPVVKTKYTYNGKLDEVSLVEDYKLHMLIFDDSVLQTSVPELASDGHLRPNRAPISNRCTRGLDPKE